MAVLEIHFRMIIKNVIILIYILDENLSFKQLIIK